MAMHPFLLWLEQLLMSRKKSRVWQARSVNSVSALTRLCVLCRMRAIFLQRRDAGPVHAGGRLDMASLAVEVDEEKQDGLPVSPFRAENLPGPALAAAAGDRGEKSPPPKVFCRAKPENNKEPSRSSSVYAQRS